MKELTTEKIRIFNSYYALWEKVLEGGIESLWAIMVYYVGPKGSGKSYSAIRDAITLDKDFTAEQILFRKEEVIDFIDKYSYQDGKVAIWDEFGSEMHAREWFIKEQRKLIQLLEVIRETDITFLICMPHLIFGDSSVDALANFCVEVYKPKHREDPYRIGKALEMDGLYSKRSKMEFKPLWLDGQILHIPYINPVKEDDKLFSKYHKKKTAYVKWRIKENRKEHEDRGLTSKQTQYLIRFVNEESIASIASGFNVSETAVKEMKRKLRNKGVLN